MDAPESKTIAMVGAGLMGHSIAQEFALAGHTVWLHSRKPASLRTARENIARNLDWLVEHKLLSADEAAAVPGRLRDSTSLQEAVQGADIVVESIAEDAALKAALFRALDALCPPHTILASNTSSLRMSEFAADSGRPDKLIMTHYFNPPHLVPLVEVVRAAGTSDDTLATVLALLRGAGKQPVVVKRELPGFIANRLQCALFREAVWLVNDGVASAEDIDTVIRTSFARRWAAAGIFQVWSLAGWDLVLDAYRGIAPDLASSAEPPPVLTEMVARGDTGAKSGKGFYEWTPERVEALRRRIARTLVAIERLDAEE